MFELVVNKLKAECRRRNFSLTWFLNAEEIRMVDLVTMVLCRSRPLIRGMWQWCLQRSSFHLWRTALLRTSTVKTFPPLLWSLCRYANDSSI